MLYDNDENNYIVLLNRQPYASQDADDWKNILFLPKASTVAVQEENSGSWTHGIVIGHWTDDNNDRKSQSDSDQKRTHAITRAKRHINSTKFFIAEYLQNEMTKHKNVTAGAERLDELTDQFTQIYKGNQLRKTE